jgi:hypothetical protein
MTSYYNPTIPKKFNKPVDVHPQHEKSEGYIGISWKKVMGVALVAIGILGGAFLSTQYLNGNLSANDDITTNGKITVFTSYTTDNSDRLAMSQLVAANQLEYCTDHSYEYRVFEKNLAAPSLPYWSKIQGIRQLLDTTQSSWIVWLDDDAIITNPSIELQNFILSHGGDNPNTHVIVTEDAMSGFSWGTDLNTGVLFVRNSKFSRKFFDTLWEMRSKVVPDGPGYTYGNCPNQLCLHEQQAMHDLLREREDFQQHVKVIPQRDRNNVGINVFERFSHFDLIRNMQLDYASDHYWTHYRKRDFIAQCTGLATVGCTNDSFWLNWLNRIPQFLRKTKWHPIIVRWFGTNYRLECVKKLIKDSNSLS